MRGGDCVGEMTRVDFYAYRSSFQISMQWNSVKDVSLTNTSVFWGNHNDVSIPDLIVDGADSYGAGGVVLFDTLMKEPFQLY